MKMVVFIVVKLHIRYNYGCLWFYYFSCQKQQLLLMCANGSFREIYHNRDIVLSIWFLDICTLST